MAGAECSRALMENGKIKVWLPAIRAGSGTDVYTRRLAAALEHRGITSEITWLPLSHELLPILLRRIQPPAGTDIIIANSWNGFSFKRFGLPLVAVVHHCVFDNELSRYKSLLQYWYHRFFAEPREVKTLRSADAVVAVSHNVANHLTQKLGIGGVEVIYNWVDANLFTPQPREARRDRPFRLLFVGKLSRLKGGDLLAQLMNRLGTGFELRITANPRECNKLNLPANMIPIGRLAEQEMIRAYQACDAVLLPSRSEGFGYSALEAMACGKPVVASNNTALAEIVQDGITGITCSTGDVEAFAEACQLLANSPMICSEMGIAGRNHAVERFAEAASIEKYLRVVHYVLGQAKCRSRPNESN